MNKLGLWLAAPALLGGCALTVERAARDVVVGNAQDQAPEPVLAEEPLADDAPVGLAFDAAVLAAPIPVMPPLARPLRKGTTVSVPGETAVRKQPRSASEVKQSVPAGVPLLLESRLSNGEGAWWYLSGGGTAGWVAEALLQR